MRDKKLWRGMSLINIYIIGGRIGGRRSSRVFFLECRSHKWSNLPSMGVALAAAAAGVVDGKIYVLGGCENPNSRWWEEVFDPKTQTWDALPMPPDQYRLRVPLMYESAVMEEKVFGLNATGTGLFYIPSEGIWKMGNKDLKGVRKGWYVIENVMYCCVTSGKILWCEAGELEWREPEAMEWREVMGLEALKDTLCASKLVNYGGGMWDHCTRLGSRQPDDLLPGHKLSNSGPNMLLFWDVLGPGNLEIFCAEISLKRRKERSEIWGNVE